MKDLGLLLLRIMTGGTLAAHGYTKLFGGSGHTPPETLTRIYGPNFAQAVDTGGPAAFAQGLEHMGVPNPKVAAYLSGAAEFGGGLALLFGLKTRLAALVVIVNMIVAIQKAHWKNGFYGQGGYEFAAQILGSAAALFLAGPGAISIDGIVGGAGKAAGAMGGGARGAAGAVSGGAASAAGAVAGGGRSAKRAVASSLPMR